jgi:hypothetical protein
MHYEGLLVGIGAFLIIGVMHPVVIKTEYYLGARAWPAYLAAGLVFSALSLFVGPFVLSALLAVTGFSFLWGIRELFEQEVRVKKGWHPANPNRKPSD